jgi:hypothetical protein
MMHRIHTLGLPNTPTTMTKYEQSFITNFTHNDLPVYKIHVAAYSKWFSVAHASILMKSLGVDHFMK